MYKRKTKDVWVVEGNYGYGWDYLTSSENRKEAYDDYKSYVENEPYNSHRIRKTREKIESCS